jgi:tRNA uridine 5-carbamoylmethylation protein Kti12
MKKIVIINRGIPASGKSTFSKKLLSMAKEKKLKAIVCSTDNFFTIHKHYNFDLCNLKTNHELNQKKFMDALKNNFNLVICDNTNIKEWEMEPYINLAKEYNYHTILLDFKPRNLQSHYEAQTNDNYKHCIPLEVLENMLKTYNSSKISKEKFDKYIAINNKKDKHDFYQCVCKILAIRY